MDDTLVEKLRAEMQGCGRSCAVDSSTLDELAALLAQRAQPREDWTPTAANINALPEPVRKYVHHLASVCDPAGDLRELAIARDTIRSLSALVDEQEAQPAPSPSSEWRDIATAPKDGTYVDLWAKAWLPAFDRFEFRRFPDCCWMKGDSMCNRPPYWLNLDKDWHPVLWMQFVPPPKENP